MLHDQSRKTIKSRLAVSGMEFHTGKHATLHLSPAKAGEGIQFRCNGISAEAKIENLAYAHKNTLSINVGGKIVSTAEHLLSALSGSEITDVYIDIVEGSEIPILDGSARAWVKRINKVGIQPLSHCIPQLKLLRPVHFKHGISEYFLTQSDYFIIDVEIDFPRTIIGHQSASFDSSRDSYLEAVAWARTFIADGAHGDKLDRTAILNRLKSVDIAKPETSPCILYEQMRYITPLRRDNEPAVHKMLDLIGDLTLLGGRLGAHVKAKCPGHHANHLLVTKLINERLVAL
jgi:UDP-3-O-[3-hydroxymyristoyl] N-acetylglucosamine deacetylase